MNSNTPRSATILLLIRSHQQELAGQGIKSLAIFGSVAREDAHAGSDVDILVEFSRPVGLFDFIGVKQYLESILSVPVDLVTLDAIHPSMKDAILKEAVYA